MHQGKCTNATLSNHHLINNIYDFQALDRLSLLDKIYNKFGIVKFTK